MTTRYRPNTFNPFKTQDKRKGKQASKIRNCPCPECGQENALTEHDVECGMLCFECESEYNEVVH